MYGGVCQGSVIERLSPILNSAVAGGMLNLYRHTTHTWSWRSWCLYENIWESCLVICCAKGGPLWTGACLHPWLYGPLTWPLTSCYGWGTLWTQWLHWTQTVPSEQPRSCNLRLMVAVIGGCIRCSPLLPNYSFKQTCALIFDQVMIGRGHGATRISWCHDVQKQTKQSCNYVFIMLCQQKAS